MSRTKQIGTAIAGLALAMGLPAPGHAADQDSMHMDMGVHMQHEMGTPAMDHSLHLRQAHDAAAPGKVRLELPDTVLTDQDGRKLRLKTDAMGGRLVVIDFVYTTCTTICPIQSALFADLQKRLGERAGKDVALLTVTVDPVRDTPQRLNEFGARFGAGPGWRFLTGRPPAVEEVLKAFDAYTPNFTDHPAAVLVGDPRTGEWLRYFGFPRSEQIMERVGILLAERDGRSVHAAMHAR